MDLLELSRYDTVVMWGGGKEALRYNGRFKLDYIVDNDHKKHGTTIRGIAVKDKKTLIDDVQEGKKVLIIISSSLYRNEIKQEIVELGLQVDITELSVILAIYDQKNISYALWGLDILIRDVLKRGGYNIDKMSYIEVGACHPILGSTSYNFYSTGTRGILMEPNPELYQEIRKYRDDICIMEGLGSEQGKLQYYQFDNEYRNTFDSVEASNSIKKGFVQKGVITLPVDTLDNIIEKNGINAENTFLSIQAMGLEKDILKTFNYKKYMFPLIALAVYSEEIYKYPIFKEYHIIAQVPRHVILVNEVIYNRIIG